MSKEKSPVFWTPPLFDDDGVQATAGIGVDGKEYGDPTPVEVPLALQRGDDLSEMIKRVVQSEFLRQKASEEGFDTPEEADDFEDEDDYYEISDYQRALMEKDLNPAPVVEKSPTPTAQVTGAAAPGGAAAPSSSTESASPSPGSISKEDVRKPDTLSSSG